MAEIPCEVCGRTKAVKPMVNGNLCQYCRAGDTKHIHIVKKLGGTPHVGGQPITKYGR